MGEIIQVKNENGELLVSARELHEGLEIESNFTTWFKRMCEYGFEDNIDFIPFLEESTGGRPKQDYILKMDCAKEIAMLQRNEKGKQIRKYFIECEKKLKEQHLQITEKEQCILSIYNGGQEGILASKKLAEIEVKEATKELKKEIEHKEDVIITLVEDIDLCTKRQRISQIVRYGASKRYAERWGLLYKEFEHKYHIDLSRRIKSCEIKPKIKNKIDYIERVLEMIPQLYEVACKLFENDVEKLKLEWVNTVAR